MSTAAESALGSLTHADGGTRGRCRRRYVPVGILLMTALLAGCTAGPDPEVDASSAAAPSDGESTEAPTSEACTSFWGDPDYGHPLARDVLDRVATAPGNGPSDPIFYSLTADDIDHAFADDPVVPTEIPAAVSDWLRDQPPRGEQADLGAFEDAWDDLAGACAASSDAAAWQAEPGPDGTKPAALVCYEVYDQPQTLSHFRSANVLTSNMFTLVGLGPMTVPADRSEDVERTAEMLTDQIDAVDDDAVRDGLEQVRAPLTDALDGDPASDGLQEPLDQLSAACTEAGYAVPVDVEDGEEEGLA